MSRSSPFRYANFTAGSDAELDLMCEVWLNDVCAAPWISREGQRLAAFIVMVLGGGRPGEVFLRDIETILNIQAEETNRGLKLLKTFRALESYEIEKGRLTLAVRVGPLQRLRMLEAKEKLAAAELASISLDALANRNAESLRTVAVNTPMPPMQLVAAAASPPPPAANG